VIENTQRDLNIALVNELAIIFNKLGIDTDAVLRAAGTKWNFLPFRPGLVGGHCIGVDPYYLTYKAEALGYYPQVVLAGRRINDSMGSYVASQLIKAMIARRIQVNGSRVLVMGLAFKENCPDLRNSRVVDVIAELTEYGCQVDVHDPWIDPIHARAEYGLELVQAPETGVYDGVILAVAHNVFEKQGIDAIKRYAFDKHVFYDLKSLFGAHAEDLRL
jgi:UDP-N-acetyl-D-galactosamine dehydrogenase